jgi:hypothetical protein
VAAERQFRLDQLLQRHEPQVLQPCDLDLGKTLVGQIGKRGAAPQRECVLERRERQLGATRRKRAPAVAEKTFEPVRVQAARIELELVPVRASNDGAAVGGERLAQPRDMRLHGLGGRGGRMVAPQLVDESIRGQRLVGMQHQQREQGALLAPAQRHRPAPGEDLQRPEDAELHWRSRRTYCRCAAQPRVTAALSPPRHRLATGAGDHRRRCHPKAAPMKEAVMAVPTQHPRSRPALALHARASPARDRDARDRQPHRRRRHPRRQRRHDRALGAPIQRAVHARDHGGAPVPDLRVARGQRYDGAPEERTAASSPRRRRALASTTDPKKDRADPAARRTPADRPATHTLPPATQKGTAMTTESTRPARWWSALITLPTRMRTTLARCATRLRLGVVATIGLVVALGIVALSAQAQAATCFGQAATISGSGVIVGTAGPDVIVGSAGVDTIDARGGDDVVCGLGGKDVIQGGLGNDRIDAGDGSDIVRGDILSNTGPAAGGGDDFILGGSGEDFIVGDSSSEDATAAGGGNDVIDAGPGPDHLVGDSRAALEAMGAGNDRIDGGTGHDDAIVGDSVGCLGGRRRAP